MTNAGIFRGESANDRQHGLRFARYTTAIARLEKSETLQQACDLISPCLEREFGLCANDASARGLFLFAEQARDPGLIEDCGAFVAKGRCVAFGESADVCGDDGVLGRTGDVDGDTGGS